MISPARPWDTWHERADTTRAQGLEWCHDGMAQRGLVVSSQAALERAEASITKAPPRAGEAIETPLVP